MISVGLLAYGASGKFFHAPFFEASDKFELSGVVERSTKSAKKNYPSICSFESIGALLASPTIKLVVVNTPSETHYEFARQALLAGKNVLVEKPMTATPNQAIQLFQLARQKRLMIFPFQNMRFASDFLTVKNVLDSGLIGRPTEVHIRWDRYRSMLNEKQWKEDPANQTSGLAYDLGPHLIDQAIALFGRPDIVYKTLHKDRPDSKVGPH